MGYRDFWNRIKKEAHFRCQYNTSTRNLFYFIFSVLPCGFEVGTIPEGVCIREPLSGHPLKHRGEVVG